MQIKTFLLENLGPPFIGLLLFQCTFIYLNKQTLVTFKNFN